MSLYDPRNRKELFLKGVLDGDGASLPEPRNREEIFLKAIAEHTADYYGAPLVASTVAGMTDKSRVYVYTGSEAGYTSGNWYYWNGTAWTSGGVYNSTALQTDKTLSISDMAADAEATGEAIKIISDHFVSGVNLFNINAADNEPDTALNFYGVTSSIAGAYTSGFISLPAGTYCFLTSEIFYGGQAAWVPTYDSDHNWITNVTGTVTDNINVFTLSQDSIVRLRLYMYNVQYAMLVSGSEYPDSFVPYTPYIMLADDIRVKSSQIIPDITSPLYGKIAVFDGDSICHGTSVGADSPYYGWGWAGRIGNKNGMEWYNVAISGATIAHGTLVDGNPRHWISSNINTIYSSYPDADYIILEGGVNDADLLGSDPAKTGIVDPSKWSSFDYDIYAEALDYLFYNALNLFPNAKIGFIIAQKMGIYSTYDSNNIRRKFFDMAIESCIKWGIPYIDLWNDGQLNPLVSSHYTPGSPTNLYTDSQHLTDAGYDIITPKIEAWMKTL